MFKHTIPYFMGLALENTLQEQKRIITLANHYGNINAYVPIIQGLIDHALELQQWLSGKLEKNDPITYFHKKALELEKTADDISTNLWHGNCLNISSVFDYACQEKMRISGKYEMMLRTHYDIQRMRLLEQVRGARLLQNNSDLGEEVEKVFTEFLKNNLDNDCLVVRGGHIFDMKNQRSKQMDIIVIPAKTLSMCPSDTPDGKFNVLIDQVIAAISVKSTLTPETFEDAWNDIQSIPIYEDKDKEYTGLKGIRHWWPLCFIVGANSSKLETLNKRWDELIEKGQVHQLQLFLSLERGYSISGNSSWPLISLAEEYKGSFRWDDGLQAGIGLGWMLSSISARSAYLSNRSLNQFKKIHKLLFDATIQTGCGCPTHTPKYYKRMGREIKGCLKGGDEGQYLHNNLFVSSLEINRKRLINDKIPLDGKKLKYNFDKDPYESRWFELHPIKIDSDNVTLREWVKKSGDIGYAPRQITFDCKTGEEILAEEGNLHIDN